MNKTNLNQVQFDFFTKQDIKICLNKQTGIYKVTMLSNKPLLFYQVWDEKGRNNNNRFANEATLNNFVKLFLDYNLKNQVKYTPTTVIDFGDFLHVLVMVNVEIDKKGRTVFYFKKDSVEIRNKIQPINSKLPRGRFNNVRFDIDDLVIQGSATIATATAAATAAPAIFVTNTPVLR
jgi:hypothetical protein